MPDIWLRSDVPLTGSAHGFPLGGKTFHKSGGQSCEIGLVTGATGILGSNVCQQLVRKGDHVRAIVRDLAREDAQSLRSAGVEVVVGDVTDMPGIQAATEGMDAVIHCAAALGRPGVTLEDCVSTNVVGTLNVMSAAAAAGGIPLVQVITLTFFDTATDPLTETSPLDLLYRRNDAYSLTKRLGYVEGMARVADGQDIRFMIPGAIYGPSICLEKTAAANSWNGRLARAIKGGMDPQLPLVIPYVTAEDCAWVCIAALEKGRSGQRYIAHGLQKGGEYAGRLCQPRLRDRRRRPPRRRDPEGPDGRPRDHRQIWPDHADHGEIGKPRSAVRQQRDRARTRLCPDIDRAGLSDHHRLAGNERVYLSLLSKHRGKVPGAVCYDHG